MKIMTRRLRILLALLTGMTVMVFVNAAYAASQITVTVVADKSLKKHYNIYAIGFSANGKGRGSLGTSTTKTGPAGARYSFGIKALGKDISCGSSVLSKNSTVVLYMNRSNRCSNKVFPKKS